MRARAGVAALVLIAALAVVIPAGAGAPPDGTGNDTSAYWTAARMAAATPRDLVIDERGLAYLRRPDGSLQPHGHNTGQLFASPASASRPSPAGKPADKPGGGGGGGGGGGDEGGGGGDTTGPTISGLDPGTGATIGASYTFEATVIDPSGVRSVSFVIGRAGSPQTQSFSASSNGDRWSVSLQGFSDGAWEWHVVAKDSARKGGNTATSDIANFTVDSSGGDPGGDVVTNAAWSDGGAVQTAAGRIYFEMPGNKGQTFWNSYVCSGTVASDGTLGRSIVITAAHCVYDDANKAFARNVLFIPDQDGTSGAGTDRNCENDPLGCWELSFGVVDLEWTTTTFPNNIPWDYAYYVVDDESGAHQGAGAGGALDSAAGSLPVQFLTPAVGEVTHALGYSYSEDPNFMYCAEAMGTEGAANWWLPSCLLSGGSSGGPWMQPVSSGNGPIISVNSWGYTTSPGMAGPKLSGSSAFCVFGAAKTTEFTSVTNRGIIAPDC